LLFRHAGEVIGPAGYLVNVLSADLPRSIWLIIGPDGKACTAHAHRRHARTEPSRRARVRTVGQKASLGAPQASEGPMTVFVYINTAKEVGDVDYVKVFANQEAAERWFEENDPEGVAFEYDVLEWTASAAAPKTIPQLWEIGASIAPIAAGEAPIGSRWRTASTRRWRE
jgi:hypothetical protein